MSQNSLKTKNELLEALEDVCEQLGWIICVPKEADDDTPTPGLIIGEEEFVGTILQYLPLENPEVLDEHFGEIQNPLDKKKETMH